MNVVVDPQNFSGRYGGGRGRGFNERGGRGNNSRFCTYYARNNHIVDTCYQKHGFPPGYKVKQGLTKYAYTAVSVHAQEDATPSETSRPNSNIRISQEQYNSLMALIQQSSYQTPASNHVSTSQINLAKSGQFSSHLY